MGLELDMRLYEGTPTWMTDFVVTSGTEYQPARAYHVFIPDAVPTDIIQLHAQFEVSVPITFNHQDWIGIGRGIIRVRDIDDAHEAFVNPLVMDNINVNMHHKACNLWGIDTGRSGMTRYYVVIYAMGYPPTVGQRIIIEPGYGRFVALVS